MWCTKMTQTFRTSVFWPYMDSTYELGTVLYAFIIHCALVSQEMKEILALNDMTPLTMLRLIWYNGSLPSRSHEFLHYCMSHKYSNMKVTALFCEHRVYRSIISSGFLCKMGRRSRKACFLTLTVIAVLSNFHQGERAPLFLALASSWGWKDGGPRV